MLRRLPFLICGITLAGIWACDSLSDPAKGAAAPPGPDASSTTQISGTLVGLGASANTRVALVWQTDKAITRGADVPVTAGRFTMSLGEPPPGTVLSDLDDVVTDHVPLDTNTVPVARAGFVVYVDRNQNQALDLDEHGVPSEQILGGNTGLVLTYVTEATTADLAPLRDDTKTRPHVGYNLMSKTGSSRVWTGLDRIELILDRSRLPGEVCQHLRTSDYAALTVDAGTSLGCPNEGGYSAVLRCYTLDSPSLCAETSTDAYAVPRCVPTGELVTEGEAGVIIGGCGAKP